MASLMQELLEVLEEEEKQYRNLIVLNDTKKDAIIKRILRRLAR